MRADRLVAILMLLQQHRRMTAEALAQELEVSIRTIYRDMEALSAAGIPVYAERGAGGGCRLLEDYHTTLTGLTENELQSLFLLFNPEPLAALGADRPLKSALMKLFASLPASSENAASLRQQVYLDWSGWNEVEPPRAAIQTILTAVREALQIEIRYRMLNQVEITRLVSPYGLVGKAGDWFAVCAGSSNKIQAFRISELLEVRLADTHFERPPDFDLERDWKERCASVTREAFFYPVAILASPGLQVELHFRFNRNPRGILLQVSPPEVDGWVRVDLRFDSFESARECVLGLGAAARVIEPASLRVSAADYARQIFEQNSAGL